MQSLLVPIIVQEDEDNPNQWTVGLTVHGTFVPIATHSAGTAEGAVKRFAKQLSRALARVQVIE